MNGAAIHHERAQFNTETTTDDFARDTGGRRTPGIWMLVGRGPFATESRPRRFVVHAAGLAKFDEHDVCSAHNGHDGRPQCARGYRSWTTPSAGTHDGCLSRRMGQSEPGPLRDLAAPGL